MAMLHWDLTIRNHRMQAQLRKAEVMSMDGEKQASSRRMEMKRAGNCLSSTSRCPIDRAPEEEDEEEALFVAGLHSLVVRSSPEYAFSRKISVAAPGSGGVDTSIWLSNRMLPTRAEARQ
jgi:hypothetical protein